MMNLNTVIKNMSVTAMACFIGFSGIAKAAENDLGSSVIFAGIDWRDKSNFSYIGLTHYGSDDIVSDGVLLRAMAGHSNYDYTSTTYPRVDATANSFEFLLGYQKVMNNFLARGFVGVEREDHDLSPDNIYDRNRGVDTGGKVRVELESDFTSPNYASLFASYGTAKNRHWARLRGGREFSGYVIGPEVATLGDQEYNESRLGLFLISRNDLPVMFSISAGMADPDTPRGDSTGYAAFEVSKTF